MNKLKLLRLAVRTVELITCGFIIAGVIRHWG